jgi:hypothetical protein
MQLLLIVFIAAIPLAAAILFYAFVEERYFMAMAAALILAGAVILTYMYKDYLTAPIGTESLETEITVTAPAVTTTVQPQRTVTTTPTVTVTAPVSTQASTQ